MYKILANTHFLGKNLIYVPQCHSTNTLAAELSQNKENGAGTLVITDDQTAGRGQHGNSWETDPGKNLTFSFIIQPRFLNAGEQFRINQAITLGIADYVQQKTLTEVKIKWPNDILAAERKVCGILIENYVSGNLINQSIVGIGVNINQESFMHPKATSLRMLTGKEYVLEKELGLLCECLEKRYLALEEGQTKFIHDNYLDLLYRINENHRFMSKAVEFDGMITGIDEVGRLSMHTLQGKKIFGVKEVEFL